MGLLAVVSVSSSYGPAGAGLIAGPAVAAALVAFGRSWGLSWSDLGLSRRAWAKGGVAVAVAAVAVVYIVAAALPATRSSTSGTNCPPGRRGDSYARSSNTKTTSYRTTRPFSWCSGSQTHPWGDREPARGWSRPDDRVHCPRARYPTEGAKTVDRPPARDSGTVTSRDCRSVTDRRAKGWSERGRMACGPAYDHSLVADVHNKGCSMTRMRFSPRSAGVPALCEARAYGSSTST